MEAQDVSNQEQDVLAGEVMNTLGENQEGQNEQHENEAHDDQEHGSTKGDSLYVQKRLKQQKRAHDREMRLLREHVDALHNSQQPDYSNSNQQIDPYGSQPQAGSVDEQIHKAVSYALAHKEMQERKAKEAEQHQHVAKQYQELHKHLDDTADKYEDFEDVVRGQHVPFTPQIRDAALMLPRKGAGSAGEVLYKLGKNPSELERISKLHPLDQAAEMVKLSHALMKGEESKNSEPARPLGQIKSNPVTNSHVVTEKTPIGSIRQRMKAGSWK